MKNSAACALLVALIGFACGGGGGGGATGTGGGPPAVGFRVTALDPRDGSVYIATDQVISATFSEPIVPVTLDERSFLLEERVSGRGVLGVVDVLSGNQTVRFTPSQDLLFNTRYRIRIDGDVSSVGGDRLQDEFVAYFRTAISNGPPPPPPPPPVPRGTLDEVGMMDVGRSSHTSTLLADGEVLVTGGFDTSTTVTGTAELFDPDEMNFRSTAGGLATPRAFHAAVRLFDGRVLILGGVTGTALAETDAAEIYDPQTGEFRTLAATMVYQRAFHTANLLPDGRVLIAGGTVPTSAGVFSSRKAEIFNPASEAFNEIGEMGVYRASHTATELADGRFLLVGGNGTDTRIETFSPAQGTFTVLGTELRAARRGHTATRLADGDVLIMGGGEQTASLFDVSSGTIRWAPSYPVANRKDHTASRLLEGHVLFTGGSYVTSGLVFYHLSTEIYDPWSGTFVAHKPQLVVPRNRHRATALSQRRILITGGQNLDPTQPELRSAEIYQLPDD